MATKKTIPTAKFTIDVFTKKELSEEQKDLVMRDMVARLQGYRTEPLLFLHDADISINRTKKKSNTTTKITQYISNIHDVCTCDKPWTVSGKCIICNKPYKID